MDSRSLVLALVTAVVAACSGPSAVGPPPVEGSEPSPPTRGTAIQGSEPSPPTGGTALQGSEPSPSEPSPEDAIQGSEPAPEDRGWSTSRELTLVRELPCFENGRRLGAEGAGRCELAVEASAADFGVFDAPAGAEAEVGLGAELAARAVELGQCYLASYGADEAVPWSVVPVVIELAAIGSRPSSMQIDATPTSEGERRFLECVQNRVEQWVLHADAPPVRVAASFIFDPFRGTRGRPVKLTTP